VDLQTLHLCDAAFLWSTLQDWRHEEGRGNQYFGKRTFKLLRELKKGELRPEQSSWSILQEAA
jgi:hypothetical protein